MDGALSSSIAREQPGSSQCTVLQVTGVSISNRLVAGGTLLSRLWGQVSCFLAFVAKGRRKGFLRLGLAVEATECRG